MTVWVLSAIKPSPAAHFPTAWIHLMPGVKRELAGILTLPSVPALLTKVGKHSKEMILNAPSTHSNSPQDLTGEPPWGLTLLAAGGRRNTLGAWAQRKGRTGGKKKKSFSEFWRDGTQCGIAVQVVAHLWAE